VGGVWPVAVHGEDHARLARVRGLALGHRQFLAVIALPAERVAAGPAGTAQPVGGDGVIAVADTPDPREVELIVVPDVLGDDDGLIRDEEQQKAAEADC